MRELLSIKMGEYGYMKRPVILYWEWGVWFPGRIIIGNQQSSLVSSEPSIFAFHKPCRLQ